MLQQIFSCSTYDFQSSSGCSIPPRVSSVNLGFLSIIPCKICYFGQLTSSLTHSVSQTPPSSTQPTARSPRNNKIDGYAEVQDFSHISYSFEQHTITSQLPSNTFLLTWNTRKVFKTSLNSLICVASPCGCLCQDLLHNSSPKFQNARWDSPHFLQIPVLQSSRSPHPSGKNTKENGVKTQKQPILAIFCFSKGFVQLCRIHTNYQNQDSFPFPKTTFP